MNNQPNRPSPRRNVQSARKPETQNQPSVHSTNTPQHNVRNGRAASSSANRVSTQQTQQYGTAGRTQARVYKKKSKLNFTPFIIFGMIVIIIIVIAFKLNSANTADPVSSVDKPETSAYVTETTEYVSEAPAAVPAAELGDDIYSHYVQLYDVTAGKVIAEKNADAEAYPASLTKIMTALVVIENTGNFEEIVTLDADMFDYIYSQGAATAGYESGEQVRMIDILNAILIPSGAEASIAAARYIAGSESEFVKLMNAKAEELGMSGTHYVNSSGLHDINHYTTAADMVKLIKYAIQNQTFRTIFTTKEYNAPATNLHPNGITFHHTMFSAFSQLGYDIGDVIGGKTGYTEPAGMCLASLESKDAHEYILVTMGAGDGTNATSWHVMDADTIYKAYT